ncbi:MAG: class II fructose-bisphosphate aldolase [Clostridiaceae bacterium]|jgi:fructose-bisphosphate aldolase class II|nr:class II fructose-bisphosphate aldolase [Clostridiaceae bacterium]
MLVTLKEILDLAEKGGFAVPAFNTYNMETVMGVIAAAEERKAPVIIQSYSRLFNSDNGYYLSPIILAAAKKATVPVCFHLDHGATEFEVIRGIRYGCSGIMIDASSLPMNENIEMTQKVAKMCRDVNISVEGEIGHVGTVNDDSMGEFTTVAEAKEFTEATRVDALAILVGTAHGRYKKPPKLDIQRIKDIHNAVDTHLVLHGGSGVPDEEIKAAISAGIRKINFGTDVCYSFLDKVFETSRSIFAIDIFMKDATNSVKEFAISKIKLLGADGKYE